VPGRYLPRCTKPPEIITMMIIIIQFLKQSVSQQQRACDRQTLINIYIKTEQIKKIKLKQLIETLSLTDKVSSKDTLFLINMSKTLHMSFVAMAHLAEGPCLFSADTEGRNFSYLPCRHTNTNSVLNGMAIYFALENINKT
jgi:hypothetical protein